ncbi:MAG: NAD(P)/FAD-dependent oxidoreductase [Candidatus Omnitrophota bacterium]
MNYGVIVIGAGAAGMIAAGRAAACGAKVLLLEKMPRPGLKLLISGKGRSNITNAEEDIEQFISRYPENSNFLRNAFHKFFNRDLMELFNSLGAETVVERGKRVFPKSQRSSTVVDALKKYLNENNVRLLCAKTIKAVLTKDANVTGVVTRDGETYLADNVILATGGLSYPRTGSSGDGYEIAKALGHTVIPPKPALVPLVTKQCYDIMGLSLENVRATLLCNETKLSEEFGDMVFTHFGISGPIILKLSAKALDSLGKGRISVSFDLKPALDVEKLDKRLLREFENGKKHYKNILKELLPRKLIPVFIELSAIAPERRANQITQAERKKIIALLKDFRLTVIGTRPVQEAIVTRGGVSTREIDPRTMQSKLIHGLYFAGELIDVDAETGGYNLQAAFSTGYVAGESAARQIPLA